MRYRADAGRRAVALDSLTAVYHRGSGQTHLLAEPAPEILAALDAGEADVSVLVARLDLVESDRAALTARLDELIATGLVEAL